ncbi:MAG TPA: glycosyltransferase [Opitutaceae bacterium]|nr:glycosyltransferase [Opitutaceae bacterium]
MKILHITNVDEAGGTNTNCLQFLKASSAANTLLVLDEPGAMQPRWRRSGVDVQYLRILRSPRVKFARVLGGAVGRGRYDLVILWCCIRVPLIRYALRNAEAKLGIHLGNPRAEGKLAEALLQAQALVFRSEVDTKLFSCSNHVRASYATGFWSRFENRVIYNPVEISQLPPAAMRQYQRQPAVVGMVARMDQIKDYPTLIRALALVRARGIAVKAELIGDGSARSELENLVETLGLQSSVRMLGYVEDVYSHLRRWSLFVYSTTMREGLGNSLLEALAAGLPCLASDLPMMREIDDGSGLIGFFRPGDEADCAEKIIAALRDKELGERASALGPRHIVSRHDPAFYHARVTDYIMA